MSLRLLTAQRSRSGDTKLPTADGSFKHLRVTREDWTGLMSTIKACPKLPNPAAQGVPPAGDAPNSLRGGFHCLDFQIYFLQAFDLQRQVI